MSGMFYLAWRYLAYNRWKTLILVGSIMLIIYLPVGLTESLNDPRCLDIDENRVVIRREAWLQYTDNLHFERINTGQIECCLG